MTSEPAEQTIATHILPNISGSKTIPKTFVHLYTVIWLAAEYNMRNIFLEKSYTKCDSFSQKYKIEHIFGSIV